MPDDLTAFEIAFWNIEASSSQPGSVAIVSDARHDVRDRLWCFASGRSLQAVYLSLVTRIAAPDHPT
jgi:hypothetical protein